MSRLTLVVTIDLEGDALSNPGSSEEEAQRILGVAADKVARLMGGRGHWMADQSTGLCDVNGNRVGVVEVVDR